MFFKNGGEPQDGPLTSSEERKESAKGKKRNLPTSTLGSDIKFQNRGKFREKNGKDRSANRRLAFRTFAGT